MCIKTKKKQTTRVQEPYYVWLYPFWVLLGGSFKTMLTTARMSWFLRKAWGPTPPLSHQPLWASRVHDGWQHPGDSHALAGCQSMAIFFSPQESLKKLAALNGTRKPHQQLTFQTTLFTRQNRTFVLTGSAKYEKCNPTASFSCLILYHPQDF